jgi:uncharacterized protein (TIGR00730 family)
VKRVCVFCGSNEGADPSFRDAAARLGRELAARRLGLVYGGGRVGLMGVLADAVLAAGGEATGVIPHGLERKELAHRGLTELHVVGSMHERKALMERLSDGFIAMPGGFGTLDELCEILTWRQLSLHDKPTGLLNAAGFFDGFLSFVDHSVAQGFITPGHRAMIRVAAEPAALLDSLTRP